jgi:crotonobetainyl-CoA:carnitine CoA-transferase CaiB-like acyl-CoA transferase
MSGFAHITGEPEGPPTLPPFGLADGIAGLAGASAVMFALYERDAAGGRGQEIDLAIVEPILTVLGAQATIYQQLGLIQHRMGNQTAATAPRNTYRTRDGHWVAISTSASSVAERVLGLVGHPEVVAEPWFSSNRERGRRAPYLDSLVAPWSGERDRAEVIARFEEAGAAVAPVYDIAEAMADPQYRALGTFGSIDDEDLGPLTMQNVMFRMAGTPGRLRFAGRRLGQDNEAVYGERLGIAPDQLAALHAEGIV